MLFRSLVTVESGTSFNAGLSKDNCTVLNETDSYEDVLNTIKYQARAAEKQLQLLTNEKDISDATKQQLKIEEYKEMLEENSEIIKSLTGKFYNIGAPLNDNVLQFNKDQQKWCFGVVALVEQLNGL